MLGAEKRYISPKTADIAGYWSGLTDRTVCRIGNTMFWVIAPTGSHTHTLTTPPQPIVLAAKDVQDFQASGQTLALSAPANMSADAGRRQQLEQGVQDFQDFQDFDKYKAGNGINAI